MSSTESKPGNAHLREAVKAIPLGLVLAVIGAIGSADDGDAATLFAWLAVGGAAILLYGVARLVLGALKRLQ